MKYVILFEPFLMSILVKKYNLTGQSTGTGGGVGDGRAAIHHIQPTRRDRGPAQINF